jgi:hypothetical protein
VAFVHVSHHQAEWIAVFPSGVPLGSKDPPNGVIQSAAVYGRVFPVNGPVLGSGVLTLPPPNNAYGMRVFNRYPDGSIDFQSTSCAVVLSQNYSPLVLDLAGKGIALTDAREGAAFDMDGTGAFHVAWPKDGAATPFLVLDRNRNGRIDGVRELFGDNTVGPDGKRAKNGFESLRKYDRNHDGVIDARDAVFARLRLWSDTNHDGKTDRGELRTLTAAGVASLGLDYTERRIALDRVGNVSGQQATVRMADGSTRTMHDVWLAPALSAPVARR